VGASLKGGANENSLNDYELIEFTSKSRSAVINPESEEKFLETQELEHCENSFWCRRII
jgi:hypothetical protein